MSNHISLTDLIDIDVLQQIQDAFSDFTGMAALTTDTDGKPLTNGSNFTDFCTKYTRTSKIGKIRCEQCDKMGAMNSLLSGEPSSYRCHAGLIDFSAPILADGEMVGCFIGGQVLTEELDRETTADVADKIHVDANKLYEASKLVNILPHETIDKAAHSLYTFANILSDIAYSKYQVLNVSREIEQAANMKSDFLANMSHEIRTPMNAVIGMAEMALREDLPPTARDYIYQIKASGNALLTIINDILDFSKIESGKMDISVVEYEPLTLINEVAGILLTRLKEKDVELILSVDPSLPSKLLGDDIRIKQVLLNIANNAVKFTQAGKVQISVSFTPLFGVGINMTISVSDTGIGIKENDMNMLFRSFQQLDSKRNRNIEGTGLGLAISKQLMTLMNGDVTVESEYGKGSTFSFWLPQRIIDNEPSIRVNSPDTVHVVHYIDNTYITEQLCDDCSTLGVSYTKYTSLNELEYICNTDKKIFLFVEESLFDTFPSDVLIKYDNLKIIVLTEYEGTADYTRYNIITMKKPLYAYTLSLILNEEELNLAGDDAVYTDIDFTAPTANVLIVDDNSVNLTVAKGLLEPLAMNVETALSGKEAIDMISVKHYDIVFMDHMMPDLDGVETTHIIRRFHPEYNDVPIIALTANAVEGTKEMFLQEGMNDFIAKPIEIRTLISKVKHWLSPEKIKNQTTSEKSNSPREEACEDLIIGDLDTNYALKILGTRQLYMSVLHDYYKLIEKKARYIKELKENEDWPAYTIEVHALKSSSKQIGAMKLSELAAQMEIAGNARDTNSIRQHTDQMLSMYLQYIDVLKPLFPDTEEDEAQKPVIDIGQLLSFFSKMHEATDNLDMDEMEQIISDMGKYSYPDDQKELFEQLAVAADNIDVDTCEEVISKWEKVLEKI